MKLAIISHTEHFVSESGAIVGWGPTVREVNHLTEVFDEVYHVAMISSSSAPKSALPYNSDKIKFVPIDQVGGKRLVDKLRILGKAPKTIYTIRTVLRKVDCFQFRAPAGFGVYVIPYLTLFVKKKGWFKYAGNWNQKNPPVGYAIQRKFLKDQGRIVTINGRWPDQPENSLSFENPCLTLNNLEEGKHVRDQKVNTQLIDFCFVGRLEDQKGVRRIIEAFSALNDLEKKRVGTIHFVGTGSMLSAYKELANKGALKFQFHGALASSDVFSIYKASHFLLLPTTASEGFPKVIAEAMNYGCIPIVSNVSSIGQYIKHEVNGIVVRNNSVDGLSKIIIDALNMELGVYKNYQQEQFSLVKKFTFTHYNTRIKSEILRIE